MKRILSSLQIAGVMIASLAMVGSALAQTTVVTPNQSLGDYAKKNRKDKDKKDPSVKQYTNDNLPTDDKISIVGATPTADAAASANANAATPAPDKTAKSDTPLAVKPGQSPAERQKIYEQWKGKIAAQKNQIDLMTRELDVAQREYQLRAAAFYADAGNRLRNSASWDKEDADYKQQLAQKQKALEDAKQQLDDMQEQARKAGVPSSSRE